MRPGARRYAPPIDLRESFGVYLEHKQHRRNTSVPPELRTRASRALVRRADIGVSLFAAGALVLCLLLGLGVGAPAAYVVSAVVLMVGLVLAALAVRGLAAREPM